MPQDVERIVQLLASNNPGLDDGVKHNAHGRRDIRTELHGHGIRNHTDFIAVNSRVGNGCHPDVLAEKVRQKER